MPDSISLKLATNSLLDFKRFIKASIGVVTNITFQSHNYVQLEYIDHDKSLEDPVNDPIMFGYVLRNDSEAQSVYLWRDTWWVFAPNNELELIKLLSKVNVGGLEKLSRSLHE